MSLTLHRDEEKAIARDYDNDSDESETYAMEPRSGHRGKVAFVLIGLLACGCVAAFNTPAQKDQMNTAGLIQKDLDTLTQCTNKCTATMTSCKKGRRLFGFGSMEDMASSMAKSTQCDTENVACFGKCHTENSAKLSSMMKGSKGGLSGALDDAEKDVEGKGNSGGVSSLMKEAENDGSSAADEAEKEVDKHGGVSSLTKEAEKDSSSAVDEAEKDLDGKGSSHEAESMMKDAEKDV